MIDKPEPTYCTSNFSSGCSSALLADTKPGQPSRTAQARPQEEWTVAIDLTVNMQEEGKYGHLGAEAKSNLLKSIAYKTKDEPIAIVVQMTPAGSSANGGKVQAERFVIEGGGWKQETTPSDMAPASSVGDLIQFAGKQYPSNKLGLFIFSHGFAYQGLKTSQGAISIRALDSSIENSLRALKRPQIDLLGFDACLMGEADVLADVKTFADNVVASPELLPCKQENSCGLDLTGWISKLSAKPEMSGDELADAAIAVTKKDAQAPGEHDDPLLLAHYKLDGEAYTKFETALNKFGADLAVSLSIPHNRTALAAIIKQTQEYDRYIISTLDVEPKDLLDFTTRVRTAALNNQLTASGDILNDTAALTTAFQQVRADYYASNAYDASRSPYTPADIKALPPETSLAYNQLGGLSVFIPDDTFRQTHKGAEGIESRTSPALPGWRSFLEKLDESP